jgi:D-alanyl-D-alanine carboxypeptidase
MRVKDAAGICVLTFFLSLVPGEAHADKVDDYINAQMLRRHIPGLSLAVVRDGKIIKVKGYGLANVETNSPATPETVYKIASISKQFLAAGIMLLVEEGKIGLDDKVSKYLDGTPETWREITIRHMLTHTSGLDDDPPGYDPFKVQADADVIRSAYPMKLLFSPGEDWSYSNVDYFALAEIIHKASGKPWSEFLTESIFAPAGMLSTRTTTTTDIVPQRASGYNWDKGRLENAENWVAVRPSGAFLSTVLDLAKWDAVLYSDRILNASIRQQMWTPVKLKNGTIKPYGFGWYSDLWQGHKRVHHGGSLPGFQSDFERFLNDKLTVIVMFNSSSGDVTKVALNVAGFYVPALAPPVLKGIADTEPEITARVKSIISGFVGGNLDMSLFTTGLTSSLNANVRSGTSDALRGPGAIRSIELVERQIKGDRRQYRYRVTYANDSLFFVCTFNRDEKVTGFGIDPE